jgi:hypothetical protein
MRKAILATVAVLSGVTMAQAQGVTNSDNVTLNVRLNPIQTLIVNGAQKTINLDYTTAANYAGGVSATNSDHLTVYSTGGFQVKVKSAGSALENTQATGPSGHIQANTVQIVPSAGANPLAEAQYVPKFLLAEEQPIITSTKGGVDKKFNIEYKGAGADAYLNHYVAGQNPTVYTTTVTYTIIAQ